MAFDPNEVRDEHGRWSKTAAVSKLAGVLKGLKVGQSEEVGKGSGIRVHAVNSHQVTGSGGGRVTRKFQVDDPNLGKNDRNMVAKPHATAEEAAQAALDQSAKSLHENSLGGKKQFRSAGSAELHINKDNPDTGKFKPGEKLSHRFEGKHIRYVHVVKDGGGDKVEVSAVSGPVTHAKGIPSYQAKRSDLTRNLDRKKRDKKVTVTADVKKDSPPANETKEQFQRRRRKERRLARKEKAAGGSAKEAGSKTDKRETVGTARTTKVAGAVVRHEPLRRPTRVGDHVGSITVGDKTYNLDIVGSGAEHGWTLNGKKIGKGSTNSALWHLFNGEKANPDTKYKMVNNTGFTDKGAVEHLKKFGGAEPTKSETPRPERQVHPGTRAVNLLQGDKIMHKGEIHEVKKIEGGLGNKMTLHLKGPDGKTKKLVVEKGDRFDGAAKSGADAAKPKPDKVKKTKGVKSTVAGVRSSLAGHSKSTSHTTAVKGWHNITSGWEVGNGSNGHIAVTHHVGMVLSAENHKAAMEKNLTAYEKTLKDAGHDVHREGDTVLVKGDAKHIAQLEEKLKQAQGDEQYSRKEIDRIIARMNEKGVLPATRKYYQKQLNRERERNLKAGIKVDELKRALPKQEDKGGPGGFKTGDLVGIKHKDGGYSDTGYIRNHIGDGFYHVDSEEASRGSYEVHHSRLEKQGATKSKTQPKAEPVDVAHETALKHIADAANAETMGSKLARVQRAITVLKDVHTNHPALVQLKMAETEYKKGHLADKTKAARHLKAAKDAL